MSDEEVEKKLLQELESLQKRLEEIARGLGKVGKDAPAIDLGGELEHLHAVLVRSGGMTMAQLAKETTEDELTLRVFLKTLAHHELVRLEPVPGGDPIYRPVLEKPQGGFWKRHDKL